MQSDSHRQAKALLTFYRYLNYTSRNNSSAGFGAHAMTGENMTPQKSDASIHEKYYVTAYYWFFPLQNLETVKQQLEEKALTLGIKGIVVIAPEGLNSTIAAPNEIARTEWQNIIRTMAGTDKIWFKNSESTKKPFRRFTVKVRKEIVTLKTPELVPDLNQKNHHLTPDEWNDVIKNDPHALIIDTRNDYEYKIGTFNRAINPNIDVFTEFPKFVQDNQIPKDKKILIFCTGGIRCEKGIMEMQRMGYENTYHLEGGILNYLEKKPNDEFKGECFVFDLRVSVDQNLEPSKKYHLCPHCGDPSETKIDCSRCDEPAYICDKCLKKDISKETCSKNCAHWWELNPGVKGEHQWVPFELETQIIKNE